MAVKYVNNFEFPSDFGFHKNSKAAVPGKARGGHIKSTTPQRFAKGGASTPCRYKDGGSIGVAAGKVKDGSKAPWNKDDATSPGSFKRTPPGEKVSNKKAANSKFDAEGRNTPVATKQSGDVERMSGYSDFKRGGKVKKHHNKAGGGEVKVGADRFEESDERSGGEHEAKDKSGTSPRGKGFGEAYKSGGRIKNLGHYAHGGKVGAKYEKSAGTPKKSGDGSKGEKSSGKATGKHTEKAQGEKRKNTAESHPKATRHEVKSTKDQKQHTGADNAKEAVPMAGGGLSRGTSKKQRAAIHAKHKNASPGLAGPLAAAAEQIAGQGMPHQPQGPGMGQAPPGMAPGMGSPPGGQMGGMAPQGPMMGAPHMAYGGGVKHVVHHHVSYKR